MAAGYDPNRPGNGWHIRLNHDLNGNGNFNDDNFRSYYLHFTANALAVVPGQIVEAGQYLGLGGSTGYSSSPHLHFEVQRSSDNFQYSYWSVDPFGWQGAGSDPWPYSNVSLWRFPVVNLPNKVFLPSVVNAAFGCSGCGEMLNNRGFESGHNTWVEQGVQVIANSSEPNLTVSPYSGAWLAWLAGRNNSEDTIYQNFTVPAGANNLRLRYRLMVSSAEPGGANDDLVVELRTSGGALLEELDSISNTFSPKNQWVQREIDLSGLSQWSGQTLRVSFTATANGSYITHFYVDEVSLVTSP
jgi:murein DD-endopeptidase MepM/ murein hydrolase activator NlpD